MRATILILSTFLFSCAQAPEPVFNCKDQPPRALAYSIRDLEKTETLVNKSPIAHGTVKQDEISGIVKSKLYADGIWAIQDSGQGNLLYLYHKETAEVLAAYRLNGMVNSDWEDLAGGYSTTLGNYLLIGDIGNNAGGKTKQYIYRFSEPDTNGNGVEIISIDPYFEKLTFTYPSEPQNAEALICDPTTQDIYVLTKSGIGAGIYVYPFPQSVETTDTLTYLGSIPLPFVTAADFDAASGELLIKDYEHIYYYENPQKLSICELLFTQPVLAPYGPVEPQGESICWDGQNYFVLSERANGVAPVLYEYLSNR